MLNKKDVSSENTKNKLSMGRAAMYVRKEGLHTEGQYRAGINSPLSALHACNAVLYESILSTFKLNFYKNMKFTQHKSNLIKFTWPSLALSKVIYSSEWQHKMAHMSAWC